MEYASTLICGLAVLSFVVARWAWKVVNWVWLRPKRLERELRKQGFQGNPYRFLVGDVRESATVMMEARSRPINIDDDIVPRVYAFPLKIIEKYGKDSFMWIGPTPRVHITNPKHLKEIFSKIYDFPKPDLNPLVQLIATGLANYEGQKWAKHRKIVNPVFYVEKLKLMVPAMRLSCDEMINKWETFVKQNENEGSCEIDVWPDLQNMSADVISRTAFGSSYQEGRTIFHLQREQAQHAMKTQQSVYIPGWWYVPTKRNRRMKEIDKEMQRLLKGLIHKREKAMEMGDEANSDDLLGILLKSNRREMKENKKSDGMSINDVIDECKLFYFAGQETSSTLLVWTMVMLSRFPKWQAKAREEVFMVFGNNDPDFDGLAHLKVVNMILNEVLRLYPPVIVLGRTVQNEMRLGDLTLPVGTQIALPTILVHHDVELWGQDAEEFKPERFAEGVSKATQGQVSFFPFAWGPRICVGQSFSIIEAKLALALILQRFDFELSPSYTHAPVTVLTLQPQHGALLTLRKRR